MSAIPSSGAQGSEAPDDAPEYPQQFAFVQERDIDFLLVEELACSLPFRRLLLGAALPGVDVGSFVPVVLHSVSRGGQGSGETDIQVALRSVADTLAGPLLVLIENKVDAVFQPAQATRYRIAAEHAELSGKYAVARTLLVAPARYLHSRPEAAEFDCRVGYEAIEGHFRERAATEEGEVSERCAHRANLVALAISKARRGYQTIPNERTTDFWQRYYAMMRANAPSLRMAPPNVKGSMALWIRFSGTLGHHPPLPRAFIIHKLEQGWVHLEFPGWADHLEQLAEAIRVSGFEGTLRARPASKSAAIAIEVPVVDARAPFELQVEAVEEGLRGAVALQGWWTENWKLLVPSGDEG